MVNKPDLSRLLLDVVTIRIPVYLIVLVLYVVSGSSVVTAYKVWLTL